ncbi:hypothetical protein HK098_004081 [Nowakowskiella sp. JEL0407]|nr:hypothetical protein HK098_004081 [Nowakowskiella sp. JEL0407]
MLQNRKSRHTHSSSLNLQPNDSLNNLVSPTISPAIPFSRIRARTGCPGCSHGHEHPHDHHTLEKQQSTPGFLSSVSSALRIADIPTREAEIMGLRKWKSTPLLLQKERSWGRGTIMKNSLPRIYGSTSPLPPSRSPSVSRPTSVMSDSLPRPSSYTPRVPSHIVPKVHFYNSEQFNNRPSNKSTNGPHQPLNTRSITSPTPSISSPQWNSSSKVPSTKYDYLKHTLIDTPGPKSPNKPVDIISPVIKIIGGSKPSPRDLKLDTSANVYTNRKETEEVDDSGISTAVEDVKSNQGVEDIIYESPSDAVASETYHHDHEVKAVEHVSLIVEEIDVVVEEDKLPSAVEMTEGEILESVEVVDGEELTTEVEEVMDSELPNVNDTNEGNELNVNENEEDQLKVNDNNVDQLDVNEVADISNGMEGEDTSKDVEISDPVPIEPIQFEEGYEISDMDAEIQGIHFDESEVIELKDAKNDLVPTISVEIVDIDAVVAEQEAQWASSLRRPSFESDRLSFYDDASAIWGSEYGDEDNERVMPTTSEPSWKLSLRSRQTRRRKKLNLNDLTELSTIISKKMEELQAIFNKLQKYETGDGLRITKRNYINTSREIVQLGKDITTAWLPIAKACDDPVLSTHLINSLVKVETLVAQMKAVTSMKNNDESDRDREGVIVASAQNVVVNTKIALSDLEAAGLRLTDPTEE